MTPTTRTPATASAYKPRRRKTSADTQDPLVEHITAQVMQGRKLLTQEDFLDVMKSVAKRLLETTLNAELGHHLDGKSVAIGIDDDNQEEEEAAPRPKNKRNGSTSKSVRTPFGELDIRTPRDRLGTFEPMLVPKRSRTMDKLNEQIIAMYGRGMTVREISAYLEDLYGIDVSAEFISNATESVLEDVNEWQSRPLESVYPVVFFDALRVKIRNGGGIKNMAVHLALGVDRDGRRDVLGMWVAENEGAAFWANVFSSLKNRGVEDILIAVTDGLKGMTTALESVFPQTLHQTCIVHLIRSSTTFVSSKDRKTVCEQLKPIYQAVDAEAAERALETFETSAMGKRYPAITEAWRRVWAQVVPFFQFAPEIRKLIYTTNSIEGLNRAIRKVVKTRTLFPNEAAAKKLIFLAIRNYTQDWKRAPRNWSAAMPAFASTFGERFTGDQG